MPTSRTFSGPLRLVIDLKLKGLILALAFALGSQSAIAQVTTIVLNTGLAGQSGSTTLNYGAADDDWNVTADPLIPNPLPRAATVTPYLYSAHIHWPPPLTNTQWISGDANRYNNLLPVPPTQFAYQACFNLPAQYSAFGSPALAMQLKADDIVGEVRLNSHILYTETNPNALAGATKAGSFLGPALAINDSQAAHFQAGQNCITVVVVDKQRVFSGMNAIASVTYQSGPCLTSGQIITQNLSTGTNAAGNKNPLGTSDPKWSLVAGTVNGAGPVYSTGTPGPWVPNAPQQANWVGRSKDAANNPVPDAVGFYHYQMPLTYGAYASSFSSMVATMRFTADDTAIASLNGTNVWCGSTACYGAWTPWQIINTGSATSFDVYLINLQTYTGLIVDGSLKMVCK
jgi:hypothetical protein